MGEVYRLSSGRLRALLRRLLPPEEVDDVLQDVFLSVWRARSFDATRASAVTWLLTIARNRAYDRLRSQRTRWHRFESLAEHDEVDPAPSPLDRRDEREARRRLLVVLRTLNPRQQAALVGIYREGLSYAELAARTGEPVSTVKSLVQRTLRLLRRSLRDG